MKKIILLAFTICAINSCKKKEPITIKQIISDQIVTITPNLKKIDAKDSVSINIPAEFEIETYDSSLESIDLYYVINQKNLMQISEFEMFINNKPINNLKFYLSVEKPLRIILREKNHLISKNYARELLKRYNINHSLEDFKLGDTIKLISYNQFRKENSFILNDLRKVGGTIIITTRKKGEEIYKPTKIKINW
ncbi:hypothetical protein HYN56_23880 [Flavobacterium crocinum]|uniref:Uncharacterized protein n=1 Tax=Flavobacterium crocinum TaxID=2183896 RepID=A0A2S1YSL2_9FLAO|nr:hypothetical protein [Flavobacterium crocinum]AWK07104.1 hypothetical protein HYN56_23880 [Flavobacterium crocinum]